MIETSHLPKQPQKSNFLRDFINNNKLDVYASHNPDSFVKQAYKERIREQISSIQKYVLFSFYTGMGLPFTYLNDGMLECAGVTDYNVETKTGTFLLEIAGNKLKIENVHSYFVYAKLYKNNKYYVLDYKHVADKNDLKDIYIAASIKTDNGYKISVFHNNEIVFEENDIYPELSVDFNDITVIYKDRVSYVRYSKINRDGKSYSNFIYSIDDTTVFQLDDSNEMPSVYLDLYKNSDWSRFKTQIIAENNAISIFLYLNNSKTSQILSEFIKNADKIEYTNNIFEDDETINYKVTYINRPIDVRFIYYCYLKDPTVLGSAVMGIPINELYKGTINNPHEYIYITSKNNSIDIRYCKKIVMELFNRCNESPAYYRLPHQVYNNYIDNDEMHVYIYQYLNDQNKNDHSSLYDVAVPYFSQDLKNSTIDFTREIEIYDNIYLKLIMENNLSVKWKNELSLFQMLKKVYPDAIYQYHTNWLGLQSLDIYVPSLKIGFEYQGQQHYQPVEYFGGAEAFEKRKFLDQKKKELCLANDVRLIEWKYDEPITKTLLKDKLAEIHK